VHVVMLLLMFTVPSNMRSTAFRTLSISIMGIYPVATALIGKILNDQAESSRKREAEEALRQSERRFALFMEHMPVFTFIKDHAFRLIYANPRMNETLGSDAWIGKLPQECFPGEAGERICRDDKQAMEAGLVHVIEVFPDMNGVERTYETLKFVIPDQDKGDMLGGIAMDITERRRAEEALNKKARELESFNSLMIGRELRMIELKKEINAFLAESGREAKYVIHE